MHRLRRLLGALALGGTLALAASPALSQSLSQSSWRSSSSSAWGSSWRRSASVPPTPIRPGAAQSALEAYRARTYREDRLRSQSRMQEAKRLQIRTGGVPRELGSSRDLEGLRRRWRHEDAIRDLHRDIEKDATALRAEADERALARADPAAANERRRAFEERLAEIETEEYRERSLHEQRRRSTTGARCHKLGVP